MEAMTNASGGERRYFPETSLSIVKEQVILMTYSENNI